MRLLIQILMTLGLALFFALLITTAWALETPQEAPRPPFKERELPPRTGFIPHDVDQSHITGQELPKELQGLMPPPAQFDWRTLGKVTSVKDQDTCGSCYAFAALANIESKMLIGGAGTCDFSENHAKECNWYDRSCNGGNYWQLANLFSKTGTVLESCDPYVAWNTTCNTTCPYQKTLLDWRRICGASVPATTVLKTYIQNFGPVYTVLYAGDNNDPTWRSTFGSYDGSYCLSYSGPYDPNHAVCIVGWDDAQGVAGGWIVKNSWGTGWGGTCGFGSESGYFYIAYGSARIGEWSSYMYDWQNYDSNGSLYYYDEGGWTNNWGYSSTTAWGMCKFVPTAACSLKRVEFWTNDITTDIDVYIYDTFSGGTLSSLLTSELNSSYSEVGYHSVHLSSPVYVSSGNDVYVSVKFTTSTYQFPVPSDDQGPSETNKTYLSHNGLAWTEMGAGHGDDMAIRLRTTTGTTAPDISVSPDTLKFGQVRVGVDSILTLRVKSTGTDTLKVTDINASSPTLAVSDTAFNLAPSESTDVTVTFTPAAVQSYSEVLMILDNRKGFTSVPVLGEGVSAGAPAISVSPDTLKYGQVPVGGDSSQTLRVRSTGTDTLHVSDINPSSLVLALSDTAFSLAPAESTDVTVTFRPAGTQVYAESLSIVSDAAKTVTVVPVTGEGIGASGIAVSPDTLKFGQVPVGSDSNLTLRVRSTGTDTLHVSDINSSAIVFTVGDTTFSLAPAESTEVTITFNPTNVQTYVESLMVYSDAAKGILAVPIAAQGTANLDLVITAGDIQFDPIAPTVDDTVTIQARVHNVTPKGLLAVADSVLVRFFDGDPDIGGLQIGSDQIIGSIQPDSSEVAQVQWAAAAEGLHIIFVRVDPDDQIIEVSEGNNEVNKAIAVSTRPMVVSMVLSDPTPTAAGEVDFAFTFNRQMDTGVMPTASYGQTSPYDAHPIAAAPGWSTDSLSWTGRDTIEAGVADGLNTVHIFGAQDANGLVMDPDSSLTFFIDTMVPASQASSPPYSGTTSFPVGWAGVDPAPGSGIATYSVYVLVDGLFPTEWLSDTADTTAVYSGSNGHSYSFYSLAKDGADNEEAAPGAPDCTTYVDTSPPAVPALLWPPDDFVTGDDTPTLAWSQVTKGLARSRGSGQAQGAAKFTPITYHLQVALNAGCTAPVVDTSGLVDTSFTVTPSLTDQPYFWRVQATDMAGNPSGFQATPFRFTVDTQSPLISGTTDWPDTGFGGPFSVEATIGDPSGIRMVLLWYRTDQDTLWQADTMTVAKEIYQGTIPGQSVPNTMVEYYVYAEDEAVPANSHTDPIGAPGVVYSFTAYTTSVMGEGSFRGAPEKFALYQNYPDPFNAATEIVYALPTDCRVRLEIYNVLGQRVMVLADGYRAAGYHTVSWDGRNANGWSLASGVYLYRLQAEGFSHIRKMVLLR